LFFRRFAALAVIVVAINATWHFFRAWLPLFLQYQHHYDPQEFRWFSLAYYACADAGSLAAGFATLALARGSMGVRGSRVLVFTLCASATTTSVVAALLPSGPLLVAVLLLIGFATLALFPAYYSFSQDLTVRHQGKLTGALGCICWMSMALLHELVGEAGAATPSYSAGAGPAGALPPLRGGGPLPLWGETPPAPGVPRGGEVAPPAPPP